MHVPSTCRSCVRQLQVSPHGWSDEDRDEHGTSLPEVVARRVNWLAGAVAAGYIPGLDEIELALRGHHLSTSHELSMAEDLDDAQLWAGYEAGMLRRLSTVMSNSPTT